MLHHQSGRGPQNVKRIAVRRQIQPAVGIISLKMQSAMAGFSEMREPSHSGRDDDYATNNQRQI